MKTEDSMRALIATLVALGLYARAWGERPDCAGPMHVGGEWTTSYLVETGEYSFEVGTASGAAGDVVPVTVSLHSRLSNPGWISLDITLCHDSEVAEVVGAPRYTEEFLELTSGYSDLQVTAEGIDFFSGLDRAAYDARFPSEKPLALMTLFYRLRGEPGTLSALRLCDGELVLEKEPCAFNRIHIYTAERPQGWDYISTENRDGALRVLEGPPTQTERPPEPPQAQIYPDLPGAEDIDFRVRVEGATASPGDREVPVEVYASAGIEYAGIVLAVDFDERYLRLARAEHHFLSGVILIDNRSELAGGGPEEGHAVVTNGFGVNRYRLAAAGEEIHAATLYFDVLDAAAGIGETSVEIETVTDSRGVEYASGILVRHRDGPGLEAPEVRSEVSPLAILTERLNIVGDVSVFRRGDANGDGVVDVSDATYGLGHLFHGGEPPPCLDAADANDDGELDISDPVTTLQHLFGGGGALPPPSGAPGHDPTPDRLGCRARSSPS